MPLLSTFGGASARALGRGTGQEGDAVLPAGTILIWDVADANTATVPSGWTVYDGFNGRFILGTSNNAQIDTTGEGSGSATLSFVSTSAGSHSGSSVTSSPRANTTNFTPNEQPHTIANGAHTHSGCTLDVSTVLPDSADTPFIITTTEKNRLPPNTVVFRKIVPSSVAYDHHRPSGNSYFSGSSTRSLTVRPSTFVAGTTGFGGTHNHQTPFTSGNFWSVGAGSFPFFTRLNSLRGSHTHTITAGVRAALKSKHLKAWTSNQEELIEYGMIVMYAGNLSTIPTGWRVCNGQLGTEDMSDFFLGYTSAEIHGDIINTTSSISYVSGASFTSESWTHTHFTSNTTQYAVSGNYHGSESFAHTHNAGTVATGTTTGYTPPWRKVAFIQYKGI